MRRAGGRSRRWVVGYRRGVQSRAGWLTAAVVAVCCVTWLAGVAAGLVGSPAVVLAQTSSFSSIGGSGASLTGASSSVLGSLVVPGLQALDGGQQAVDAQQARWSSSAAFAARARSRTEFAHLGTMRAAQVAREAFPGLMDEPDGGLPQLPAGQRIVRYVSDNVAQVDLGGGRHGVIESTRPIAVKGSSGRRAPVALGLAEAEGGFHIANPAVPLGIPKRLSSGVRLAGSGVSFTPVDARGAALAGSQGTLDGAGVLYANTQTDADTVIKPVTLGFEVDTVLRSPESPQQLYFRMGLPAGASLVQRAHGSRAVQVVRRGRIIATVLPPGAQDAAGMPVPVSMQVSGDTLQLAVAHKAGEFEYPIVVDPTVEDKNINLEYVGNWHFYAESPNDAFTDYNGKEGILEANDLNYAGKSFGAPEWGQLTYGTQGESRIYKVLLKSYNSDFEPEGSGRNVVQSKLYIYNTKKVVEGNEHTLATSGTTETTACVVESNCEANFGAAENKENVAVYHQTALVEHSSYKFENRIEPGTIVYIVQEKPPTTLFNKEAEFAGSRKNALYGERWSNAKGAVEVKGSDPGIGVDEISLGSPQGSTWGYKTKRECSGAQCPEDWEGGKKFVEGGKVLNQAFTSPALLAGLPEGEDTVEASMSDAAGLKSTTVKATVKVDDAAPHNIVVTGLPHGNENGEIGEGQYPIKIEATDGSGSTKSSGVASIALTVEGKEIGKPEGSCTPGPCTAVGEWTLNGPEFGSGEHRVRVMAIDNAGNVAVDEFTLKSHHATPIALGPGSVNPQSGEFTMSASDVSIGAPGGSGLTVSRSYGSRHLTAGSEGAFGPQWSTSLGGVENLVKTSSGSVVMTNSAGMQTTFLDEKGELEPPLGDANVKLTTGEEAGKPIYTLSNTVAGTKTKFALPSVVGEGTPPNTTWFPVASEGLTPSKTETFAFQTVQVAGKWIVQPTQELAPAPAGVSCSPTLTKGCRALSFTYATATTATGEAPSEWGEYAGHLKTVSFKAYNPSAKEMVSKAVAEYSYDKQGRLRAEWNPQISPALKTIYGYDAEGHVTAVAPAGQQPWLLHYGTIEKDANAGRLLSVTRPSASTALGEAVAPVNTTAPALSTTSPVEGTTLSVSTGSWSNSPLSYSYQWEECPEEGGKEVCTPILGATNQTYTPPYKGVDLPLRVQVTATNSDGLTMAYSNKSNNVMAKIKAKFGTSGSGKLSKPAAAAVDSSENVWVTDTGNHRVVEFSSTGTFIAAYGWGVTNGKEEFQTCTGSSCLAGLSGSKEGEFKEPDGIAIDKKTGDVYIADAGNTRIVELSSAGKYLREKTTTAAPAGIAIGTTIFEGKDYEELYATEPSKDAVQDFLVEETSGSLASRLSFGKEGSGEEQFKDPTAVTTGDALSQYGNYIYVSDTGNDRIEVFEPLGLGNVVYLGQFGKEGKGEGQFSSPGSLAFEPEGLEGKYDKPLAGHLFVTDTGNSRVQEFNESSIKGVYLHQYSLGSGAQGIAFNMGKGASAGDMYLASVTENAVVEWEAGLAEPAIGPPEPPNPGTNAVTTIEYKVPLSGSELKTMTKTEVEKWGQTDDPTEATAIFPPDEPMGWPAKDYKRATVSYYDTLGRLVNVATPTGGVLTSEYNEYNDLIRSLSPDNRAAALAEGSKSSEVSKLLDTESKYNGENEEKPTEPGTRLLETLGPQHTVKLSSGSEVKARDHKHYYYNEGAPAGEAYDLVTKTVDGAEYEGKEADVRTTTTSYWGQEGLGWKLRKPTSVTTDPGANGLQLVHATVYEAGTGNVTETKMPAASPKEDAAPKYDNVEWNAGSAEGIAIDGSGDVWLSKAPGKDPLAQYGGSGTLLHEYGEYSSEPKGFLFPLGIAINKSTGYVYASDLGEKEINVKEFTTGGEYKGVAVSGYWPVVAVDEKGDLWTLYRNEIHEYSSSHQLLESFGETGKGAGQLEDGKGIAVWHGLVFVTDSENDRVLEFSTTGQFIREFGGKGNGNGQFVKPVGIAVDPTSEIVYVVDSGNDRVQEFSIAGEYLTQFGSKGTEAGKLEKPEGIAINSSGGVYILDRGNKRVEEWLAKEANGSAVHNTQTIYYTTAANEKHKECGEHAEWANLPCLTQPAKQPETSGLWSLPVTTVTYNVWDEPEKTTETVEKGTEKTTRTKTATYDAAGRVKTSAVSSTIGTALPIVTDEYNEKTGALEKQCTNEGKACIEGKPKTITSVYNTLGQLTSYTDAGENTTTYEYEKEKDARLIKVNDGKGTETYTYSKTTGLPTELLNEYGTTKLAFTATYDTEGNMLTEGYPNGMTATYAYDATGKPIDLQYKKTTDCTEEKEKCVWFKDAVVPSIHGQWLEQNSTLSKQNYTYDAAGRLTQVQNTPAAGKCTTRIYAYDEDTNRLSLTTREPKSNGECATEGGTVEKHTYDEADRLADTGIVYNTFGDVTTLPAGDAGGKESSENLTSTYYTNNQVASQTQNGQTIGFNLDPAGRTIEDVGTGKKAYDTTLHYAGPGNSPAWTSNSSGETTRNITGIGGGLAAIQNNSEAPELQLANLHGDIIAKAYLSETATGLASTADTSEFGVPTTSLPSKYSWLGALELPTELPSGVTEMGARSYVPQLGRFLQPDPLPGGSANEYTYTFGDPVNSSDPSGEYAGENFGFLIEGGAEKAAQEEAEYKAAIEAAARAAAEQKAEEAALMMGAAGPQYEGEEEWYEEYEEEEGGYEYASYHHGGKPESEEGHVEDAVLVQSLSGEEAGNGEGGTALGSMVPLCKAGSEGPCARDAGENDYYTEETTTERRGRRIIIRVHRYPVGCPTTAYAEQNGMSGSNGSSAKPGYNAEKAALDLRLYGYVIIGNGEP